jgi:hypothetical protein
MGRLRAFPKHPENFAKDKHSSLLRPSVSDQEEEKCLIHQHQAQQEVSVVP